MASSRRFDLPPDTFAVVMATGIVSIAATDHRYRVVATVLAFAATVAFVLLAIAWLYQLVARRDTLVADFRDPDAALRMFTVVAAACVLGVVWIEVEQAVVALAVAAIVSWLVLVPLAARDVRSRPNAHLRDHVHGAWLLASVATSGLATTAADLALIFRAGWFVDVGAAAWVLAWAMYLGVLYLMVWRVVATPFGPEAVRPDAWIVMGALAIAALAGAHLSEASAAMARSPLLTSTLRLSTVVVVSLATIWIPVLIAVQMWRIRAVPGSLQFAHVWWSAIFPLGMYAAATAAISRDLDVPTAWGVSLSFTWIAMVAWMLAAAGAVRQIVRFARPPAHPRPSE